MKRLAVAALSLLASCSPDAEPPAAVDPFRIRSLEAALKLRAADSSDDRSRWVRILSSYAGDANPEVAVPAVEALHAYVTNALRRTTAPAVDVALDALLKAAHPEAVGLLRAVLASRLDAHTRVTALWRLGDRPETELSVFVGALSDPDLAGLAACVIGRKARGSRDPDLIRRLRAAGDSGGPTTPWEALSWAMRSVGGEGVRSALAPWADRLGGGARSDLLWFLEGIDPWHVAVELVKREILPPYRFPERLEQTIQESTETPSPVSIDLLSAAFQDGGRVVRAPLEGDGAPDTAGWLELFAAASDKRFKPARVARERREIRFENAGRIYRCAVREPGQAHDLILLAEAVNRALEDSDVSERFVKLDAPPAIACFILVIPDRFRPIASEFHLPVELQKPGRPK